MKTKKQFRVPANRNVVTGRDLSLLMFLPLLAIFLISFSSPPLPPQLDQIFKEVDEMPLYKGGDAALLKYIAENTKYPEQAKLKGITGRVIVKLVVEKNCTVSNVEIAESANPLLDAEAIRVVNTLPAFEKAGIKDGKKVRVAYMVPITFTLN